MHTRPHALRQEVLREWPLAALTVAGLLLSFFLALGRPPLFDVDEGAFSQATLEMFARGDFLSTYLNGAPRYDKPILVYWLQAASVAAFGASEFAFRLPSAVCATLWCLLVFLFAHRRYGPTVALLAAGSMATSVGVFAVGRFATADGVLNLLVAASMFSAWLYLERGDRRWLYASFAAAALGFLAKGPVAILIPLAVTLLFCLLRRDLKTWMRAAFDARALLLFCAIALPWYVYILQREGWAFVEVFFMKHNIERFSRPLQSHSGGLAYYLPVALVVTLPHTALLVRAFARIRHIWRDDLQCYLLLWFAFVFLFFSFSGTKLPHYLMYGMTGLFLLMAIHGQDWRSRFWPLLPALLGFAGLALLPYAFERLGHTTSDAYYRATLGDARLHFPPAHYAYSAAAAGFCLWLMAAGRNAVALKLVAAGALLVTGLASFVLPAAGAMLQEPVRQMARYAREQGHAVTLWRFNAPSFSVYYGAPTPTRDPRPGDLILTRADRLAELGGLRFDNIHTVKGLVLIRIRP
jgi:4-amino-4-deoxy-L-arabinose transferase-like glycosyltransferase